MTTSTRLSAPAWTLASPAWSPSTVPGAASGSRNTPGVCGEICKDICRDILDNEDFRLDQMFLASLVGDIVRGIIVYCNV